MEKLDGFGRTELLNAVIDNQAEDVARLLGSGADINHQDKLGFSSLHYAAQNSSNRILALLLNAAPNVNCQDKYGNTPLSKAVFAFQGDNSTIQLLVKSGADPDIENFHSVSPRDLANKMATKGVCFDLES